MMNTVSLKGNTLSISPFFPCGAIFYLRIFFTSLFPMRETSKQAITQPTHFLAPIAQASQQQGIKAKKRTAPLFNKRSGYLEPARK